MQNLLEITDCLRRVERMPRQASQLLRAGAPALSVEERVQVDVEDNESAIFLEHDECHLYYCTDDNFH